MSFGLCMRFMKQHSEESKYKAPLQYDLRCSTSLLSTASAFTESTTLDWPCVCNGVSYLKPIA